MIRITLLLALVGGLFETCQGQDIEISGQGLQISTQNETCIYVSWDEVPDAQGYVLSVFINRTANGEEDSFIIHINLTNSLTICDFQNSIANESFLVLFRLIAFVNSIPLFIEEKLFPDDFNACIQAGNICNINGQCSEDQCICNMGFTGDGVMCTEILPSTTTLSTANSSITSTSSSTSSSSTESTSTSLTSTGVISPMNSSTSTSLPTVSSTTSSTVSAATVSSTTSSTVSAATVSTMTASTSTLLPTVSTMTSSTSTESLAMTSSTTTPEDIVSSTSATSTTTTSTSQPPPAPPNSCGRRVIDEFTFPATRYDLFSSSVETCDSVNLSLASIRCGREPDNTLAFDISTLTMLNCADTISSVINKTDVSTAFKQLQILTSNPAVLTLENVTDISNFFLAVLETDVQLSKDDIENVVEITSHVSTFFTVLSQEEQQGNANEDKQNILQSVSLLGRRANSSFFDQNLEIISEEINLQIQDIAVFTNVTIVSYNPQFYQNESSQLFTPVQIDLPAEAVEIAQQRIDEQSNSRRRKRQVNSVDVRIVYTTHRSNALFPSQRVTEWVTSVELGNNDSIIENINLQYPVIITNQQVEEEQSLDSINRFRSELTNLECVFWDFSISDWSREGCCLVPETPPKCQCSHLTNFAVLVSRTEIPSNTALDVVSDVGCSISILGFILTFAALISTRKTRNSHPMQVIMNICFCMTFVYFLFLLGVERSHDRTLCSVIAAFLQYGLLAAWCWMGVYTIILYKKFVRPMASLHQEIHVMRYGIFAYGLPLVIVLLNAGIALGYIDQNAQPLTCANDDIFVESSYNSRNFCWLRHHSLYFGMLLPVGLILLFNIVVYCIAIPKITCMRRKLQSTVKPKSLKNHLIISIAIAMMIGLCWIFGYLMLISDNPTYLLAVSWIFTIFNTLQGLGIFVMSVLRNKVVRKALSKKFNIMEESTTSMMTSTTGPSNPSTL